MIIQDKQLDSRQQQPMLTERVQMMLQEARRAGADSAEVSAFVQNGFEVTVRQGDLDKVQFNQDQGFSITLYSGYSRGSANTTAGDPDSIRETIQSAWRIAQHAEEDTCSGLADSEQMATAMPDLDLYHPWSIGFDEARVMALEAEACAKAADSRISNSDGATVSSTQGCNVYGNTHGFLGTSVGTRHSLSCAVIASDSNEMQQDYWYTVARRPGLLESAESVGERAGSRAVSRLGARPIATGKMPVLLAPWVASGFLGHLLSAISGGSLYRKSSFLLDSLGQQVLPARYSLREQPYRKGGLGSAAFDGDGLATREQSFVVDGVLEQYVLSTYSARRLGLQSTANAGGVHNLTITHDDLELEELLKAMGDGLYVTELFGPGVNIVTGDYSRGGGGFLVEKGRITRPVQGITLAGNLAELFRCIRLVGRDLDIRRNIQTGSLLIDGFTLGGS